MPKQEQEKSKMCWDCKLASSAIEFDDDGSNELTNRNCFSPTKTYDIYIGKARCINPRAFTPKEPEPENT